MKLIIIFSIALLFYTKLSASAPGSEISITGIVTDGSNPIEKAVVTLVKDSMFTDTTDSKGAFSLSNATGMINKADWNSGKNSIISFRRSRLHFSIPGEIATGDVILSTASGRCIGRYSVGKKPSGLATIDLPKLSTGLYLVTFSSDRISIIRKILVTSATKYFCEMSTTARSSTSMQKLSRNCAAAVDQLKITKEGFVTKLVDLSSYKIKNLSIVLVRKDSTNSETSLYKKYRNYFAIGAAIDANSYKDAHTALWKEHFNATVCENEMKWTALQPSEGSFQFSQANTMVNAARSNGMLVRGHVLVWFDQTPDWVFQNSSGGQSTKQVLLERIRTHVTKVMQEFKGRVYAWDVVNEAVIGYNSNDQDVGEDLGSLARWGYRNSKWYQIAGEDYIFEAFKAARAADPDAKLFYNDFWNYLDGKRQFIISFVKKLKDQNLIDGVGLQYHLNISPAQVKLNNQTVYQTVPNLEKEIQEYAALGLDVHITELDISIYTRDYTSDDQSHWYTGNDLNEEYQTKLAARYKEVFDMFRRNADKIKNVTFWGIADDNTWLSEFPSGRPDHPLLFDKHLNPKKAFDAIMNF
jgi:endo-1,4-beta-xylanase